MQNFMFVIDQDSSRDIGIKKRSFNLGLNIYLTGQDFFFSGYDICPGRIINFIKIINIERFA